MPEDVKAAPRSAEIERRRSQRWVVTLGLVADIDGDSSVRGYLFDISLVGAYVVLDTNAEIPTRVTLAFRVGTATDDCRAMGHVARFESLGRRSGLGIAFTEASPSWRAFVGALANQNDSERLASFHRIRSLRLTLR